jgi:MFS family permease
VEPEERLEPAGAPLRAGRLARMRRSRAMAAWDSPPFRRYFWVQALQMAGRMLQTTIIGYIVYDLTRSDFLLGLVSFMQMVPQLLLAPFVGVLVDRVDRKLIIACQLAVQGIGLFALALLSMAGLLTVPAIAAVVVLMGIANATAYPSHSSFLPSLVPLRDLQSANAINSMMGNVSRIVAPAAAGFIIDASGATAALMLGTGLYAPAVFLVMTVPVLAAATQVSTARGPLEPAARPSVRGDIVDAITYIRSNALLRAALANDVVPYLFGLSHIALLPAIASGTLGGNASTLGLLYGMSGAGALVGTLAAGMLSGRGLRGPTIWVSTIGFGVGLLIVALNESAWIIMPGLAVTGCFQMVYIIQNDTLVQTFADPRFRGRALAAQSMVNGLMPIGFLLLGTIAELTNVRVAFAVAGAALIASGIATVLFRPVMRDLR